MQSSVPRESVAHALGRDAPRSTRTAIPGRERDAPANPAGRPARIAARPGSSVDRAAAS